MCEREKNTRNRKKERKKERKEIQVMKRKEEKVRGKEIDR